MEAPTNENGQLAATRCNCTLCQKLRSTNLMLKDPSDFKLLSPASKDELDNYAPRVKSVNRYFCSKCGVHVWMEGYYEFDGKRMDIFAVNLASVDQPQDGIDMSEVKISYFDGLHKNFYAGLTDSPWPCGLL